MLEGSRMSEKALEGSKGSRWLKRFRKVLFNYIEFNKVKKRRFKKDQTVKDGLRRFNKCHIMGNI